MFKKKYVICFTGLFEYGYFKHTSTLKRTQKTIPFKTEQEAIKFATKFYFKWTAKLCCFLLNYTSKHNFDLRTFYIKQI